jgi:hypothetical protein
MLAVFQSKQLQRGGFSVDTDAGCDPEAGSGDDHSAIWSPAGFERGARFQSAGVEQCNAGAAAVGYQDLSVVGDRAGRARKSRQRRKVAAGVVVDHLNAIARGMCNEDTPAFRIEAAWSKSLPAAPGMAMVPTVFSGMTTSWRRARCRLRWSQSGKATKENRPWLRPRAISSNIESCAELGRRPSSGESAFPQWCQTSPVRAFPQVPDGRRRSLPDSWIISLRARTSVELFRFEILHFVKQRHAVGLRP